MVSFPRLSSLRDRDGGWRSLAGPEPLLFVRYVLVSGVLGVPLSIVTLWGMIWAYEQVFGDYNWLTLNILFLLNFELGLTRNFLLHCAFTWRLLPSWRRYRHAHVAAVGALAIDIVMFNVVLHATGILFVAQIFSAGSGFAFNFLYNRFKTFSRPKRPEVMAEEAAV